MFMYCIFYNFSQHHAWHRWLQNPSLWDSFIFILNDHDDLVTQGTKASVDIVSTLFSGNSPASALEGLNKFEFNQLVLMDIVSQT